VDLTAFNDGSEIEAGSMLKFLAETHSMALHFDTPRRFRVPKPIAERVECETESSQQFSA
jgi:hypothetical protein